MYVLRHPCPFGVSLQWVSHIARGKQWGGAFTLRPIVVYRFTRCRSVSVNDGALVERTGNHVELLFLGELDEVHRVAGDTHGQVRVLFGVLDGVLHGLLAQNVDVRVVEAVAGAGVQDADQVAVVD